MSNTSLGKDTQGGNKDWMQTAINKNENMRLALENAIGEGNITWLSPLADDKYKEYQLNNKCMSNKLALDKNTFSSWWPFLRQPQWDAIGKTDKRKIILVEAKAHLKETVSPCTAIPENKKIIQESLKQTHDKLSAVKLFDEKIWMNKYYQIANRLLFWINLQSKLETNLIFLNFINIPCVDERRPPATAEEWDNHYNKIFDLLLGYGVSKLPNGIKFINFDIKPFL